MIIACNVRLILPFAMSAKMIIMLLKKIHLFLIVDLVHQIDAIHAKIILAVQVVKMVDIYFEKVIIQSAKNVIGIVIATIMVLFAMNVNIQGCI